MGERWGGLQLGDVVAPVSSAKRMVVTDLDLDDPRQVVCAWKEAGRANIREGCYRVSGLVFITRTAQAAPGRPKRPGR
jgi:hypothetical protein